MPAAESCAAMLLLLAAAANEEREAPETPPPELLLYLAEFEQDPVAVEAAMRRDADAAPDETTELEREHDPAPR
jgi:hypothetical protein